MRPSCTQLRRLQLTEDHDLILVMDWGNLC